MKINGLEISDELISEKTILLNDIRPLLKREFGIETFNQIWIHGKEIIIKETEALKRLGYEDKNHPFSYWIGTKAFGVSPGDIDFDKMLVIANFDYDVPVCLDYRNNQALPSVIWLNDRGVWEKICESHAAFMKMLNEHERN